MKKLLLVMAGLLFADCAKADSITDLEEIESTLALMPNYGANDPGFLELEAEIQGLLGPSMEWTTAGNVATIDYWLSLASSLGESAALANDISGVFALDDDSGTESPEPATLVLLGGGVFFLIAYAARGYGTGQQTHRFSGHRLHSGKQRPRAGHPDAAAP